MYIYVIICKKKNTYRSKTNRESLTSAIAITLLETCDINILRKYRYHPIMRSRKVSKNWSSRRTVLELNGIIRLFKNSPRILYPRFDSRKRRHVMSKQTNNKACQGSRHYWSLLGGRLTCGGVTSASRRRRLMPAFSHRGHVASRGCNADNVTKMTGGIPYIPLYCTSLSAF